MASAPTVLNLLLLGPSGSLPCQATLAATTGVSGLAAAWGGPHREVRVDDRAAVGALVTQGGSPAVVREQEAPRPSQGKVPVLATIYLQKVSPAKGK